MWIFLKLLVHVLAAVLIVLEAYRWYRKGYEEGFDNGYEDAVKEAMEKTK